MPLGFTRFLNRFLTGLMTILNPRMRNAFGIRRYGYRLAFIFHAYKKLVYALVVTM